MEADFAAEMKGMAAEGRVEGKETAHEQQNKPTMDTGQNERKKRNGNEETQEKFYGTPDQLH